MAHYTPDGRFLTYTTFAKGAPFLAVYDRSLRASAVIRSGADGQFSPDGKSVAYLANADRVKLFCTAFSRQRNKSLILQWRRATALEPRRKSLFFIAPDRKPEERL